jgi:hypothetical protein
VDGREQEVDAEQRGRDACERVWAGAIRDAPRYRGS